MEEICGYLVLRKPSENFDNEGRGAYKKNPPNIGNIFYGGIDRMAWFDIDEEYFSKQLPLRINQLRNDLKNENKDFSGILLSRDFQVTMELLKFSNLRKENNEIIVIHSTKIEKIKGCFKIESQVDWMGIDIVDIGHWSLLRDGLFIRPDLFSGFINVLNPSGLFSLDTEAGKLVEYYELYKKYAGESKLEPIIEKPYGVDRIKVGKLKT